MAMVPLRLRIVDKTSAFMGPPNQEPVSMNTDHRDTCRYPNDQRKEFWLYGRSYEILSGQIHH
jgi:hypothetical protein